MRYLEELSALRLVFAVKIKSDSWRIHGQSSYSGSDGVKLGLSLEQQLFLPKIL